MKNTAFLEITRTNDIGDEFIKTTILSQQGKLLKDYEEVILHC